MITRTLIANKLADACWFAERKVVHFARAVNKVGRRVGDRLLQYRLFLDEYAMDHETLEEAEERHQKDHAKVAEFMKSLDEHYDAISKIPDEEGTLDD